MEAKVLKTGVGEYVSALWTGENKSGYEPLSNKVLVLVDVALNETSGGVHIPQELIERQQMAAETGILAAIGPSAFLYRDDGSRWDEEKPALGARVWIERYAGQVIRGEDDNMYRLMDAKCVGAVKSKDGNK